MPISRHSDPFAVSLGGKGDSRASFRYDVAISAVSYDASTAERLEVLLRPHLSRPLLRAWEEGSAERSATSEARVVVVLHQRLWGETTSTRADAAALERRVAEEGSRWLRVIALEEAPAPAWMPPPASWLDRAEDTDEAIVGAIVAAVAERGGTAAAAETAFEADARTTSEEAASRGRDIFMNSPKAATASTREFDALVGEIERALTDAAPNVVPTVRRSPARCIVQVGRAGLSLTWFSSRTAAAGEGSLLVIEWDGMIASPGASQKISGNATPLREQLFHPDGTGSAQTWRWCAEGTGSRIFTSNELAGQSAELLLRRAAEAPAVA